MIATSGMDCPFLGGKICESYSIYDTVKLLDGVYCHTRRSPALSRLLDLHAEEGRGVWIEKFFFPNFLGHFSLGGGSQKIQRAHNGSFRFEGSSRS